MIAGQSTAAAELTEGAFDDPATRLHGKAFLALVGHDGLDGDCCCGADALALVATVGKAVAQERPQTSTLARFSLKA